MGIQKHPGNLPCELRMGPSLGLDTFPIPTEQSGGLGRVWGLPLGTTSP